MKGAIENCLLREERYEQEKAEDQACRENYLITGQAVDGWLQELSQGKPRKWRP